MPIPKINSKPVPLKRGFKAEAERKSAELRTQMGLKDYDPLPAQSLADHLGIRILVPRDIPKITDDILDILEGRGKDNWSAAIYIKNDKKFIIHNPTHSPLRQESNLMHELAHAICDHSLQELETAMSGCIIPLRKYDVVQEAEAECLGGCLQLPQKALFYYYHVLNKTPEEISQIFSASKEMVRFRMSITAIAKIKYKKGKS